MREHKKLIGKILKNVAEITSESASLFCLYEPQMPSQLLKKKKADEKYLKKNRNV